jgi:hypothetical protein
MDCRKTGGKNPITLNAQGVQVHVILANINWRYTAQLLSLTGNVQWFRCNCERSMKNSTNLNLIFTAAVFTSLA